MDSMWKTTGKEVVGLMELVSNQFDLKLDQKNLVDSFLHEIDAQFPEHAEKLL